ncbi:MULTISPECIES: phosphotransferase family protein [unclassified Corynebacterium]|uniref:phosphotransferase family protein n=1 Tax=unclassified Corynebacterium TaxID=2624378 RepID=UPI001C457BE0|nr:MULTISPECIES: phosphotransferase [unclassified Corynebacterium]MBV7280999.1 phosphotransferase [Corynebacterium sp. TAE3-ERU30]MBV7302721.1 phosphotransferase [Corynebacterium sp. TAE3-ERU2]
MSATITPTAAVEEIHEHVVARAEKLLCKRYGGSLRLVGAEILEGSGNSTVLRLKLTPSPYLQERTVVVKHSPSSDDPLDPTRFLREVVAYQFTTSLPNDVRPGPVLLAYDMEERLLVISDCGDVDTFADLMDRADTEQRRSLLRRLGRALGLLHSASADHEQDFDILFRRMVSKHGAQASHAGYRDQALETGVLSGLEFLEKHGVVVDDTVRRFAHEAQRRLVSGQHRAFTPFDLSPDNIVYSERPEFLDYEWAGFRDATFDVACVVAGFPQFVFSHRLSDQEADLFVEAWRQEVSAMWPNVNNPDRLRARIVTALVGWAVLSIWHLNFGPLNILDQMSPAEDSVDEAAQNTNLGWSAQQMLDSFDDTAELERLAKIDIYETFDALIRFAQRSDDPRFPAVVDFAQHVIDRFVGAELAETLRENTH